MSETRSTGNAWASGLAIFAAAMLFTVGVLQVLEGIVALANDEFYVVGLKFAYEFDLTAWGWIHIVVGVILVVVGFFLFSGNPWARGAGIGIACLSLIANFMWLPYYPFWAIVLISLDIAIVWALAVYEPDEEGRPAGRS